MRMEHQNSEKNFATEMLSLLFYLISLFKVKAELFLLNTFEEKNKKKRLCCSFMRRFPLNTMSYRLIRTK